MRQPYSVYWQLFLLWLWDVNHFGNYKQKHEIALCDQMLSHIRNTATSQICFGIFLLSLFLKRKLVRKRWWELASMVHMNKWLNFCIVANVIRWYSYSLKSEQLNLYIGNDFFFLFEMLVNWVMLFLSLSCLYEVTNLVFVMCWFLILILLLFVWHRLLFGLCICFPKENMLQKTWEELGLILEMGDLQTFHTFGNMISWLPQHKPNSLHNRCLLTYLCDWIRLFIEGHCFSFAFLSSR